MRTGKYRSSGRSWPTSRCRWTTAYTSTARVFSVSAATPYWCRCGSTTPRASMTHADADSTGATCGCLHLPGRLRDYPATRPLPQRAHTRPERGVGRPSGLPRSRRRPHHLDLPHMRPDRVRAAAQPTARLWTGPRPCVFPTSVTCNEIMSIPLRSSCASLVIFSAPTRVGYSITSGCTADPMGDNRWMVRPNEEKSFFRSFDLADE